MPNTRDIFLVFVSLVLGFCSCSKLPFSNGFEREETRSVHGYFKVLEMNDDVDVTLIRNVTPMPDSTTKVKVIANENLMEGVTADIHGDTLTLRNTNTLNWMRPYDYTMEATVFYDTLTTIICNSNGKLNASAPLIGYYSTDSINDSTALDRRHLYLQIEGGSGDINLPVDCDVMHTQYNWGTSSVNLSGKVGIAFTSTTFNCHGPIDASDMEANYHYIYNYGTNKIIARAFTEVNASNYNNGIVCYIRYLTTRQETIWGHYDENHIWIPPQVIEVTHNCPKKVVYTGNPNQLDSIVWN